MYRKILVPVDGSPAAERALREGIRLAASLKATLRVLHVVSGFPLEMELSFVDYRKVHADQRRSGSALLGQAVRDAASAKVSAEPLLRERNSGAIGDLIVEEAVHGCDLIVMGTHGRRGLRRFALGSDAERVLRDSPVPVLLMSQGGPLQ